MSRYFEAILRCNFLFPLSFLFFPTSRLLIPDVVLLPTSHRFVQSSPCCAGRIKLVVYPFTCSPSVYSPAYQCRVSSRQLPGRLLNLIMSWDAASHTHMHTHTRMLAQTQPATQLQPLPDSILYTRDLQCWLLQHISSSIQAVSWWLLGGSWRQLHANWTWRYSILPPHWQFSVCELCNVPGEE